MKLEMICTGEEVLAGQIVDTNAAWLGNELMDAGFEMQRRTTIGDRLDDLIAVFSERSQYADIILVNGGLGPTADDLSTQAMAQAMAVELVENKLWRATLEQRFSARNLTISASNLKQALLPQGAVMIENPVGTACGFRVKLHRAWLFFTPGVPHEFKHMITHQFIPFVKEQALSAKAAQLKVNINEVELEQVSVTKLLTLGIGESAMADLLEPLSWPHGISLGYRSFSPYLELKLIARQCNEQAKQDAYQQAVTVLADSVVAQSCNSVAERVHHLLVASTQTLAIAESLTGGDISSQLVNFAGSSAYLKQGIVTYCNEAKKALLAVSSATILQHSEVSLDCVIQMATGAACALTKSEVQSERLITDFAVATSGVAGPGGGSEQIPVGTVVIAVKAHEKIYSQKVQFSASSSRHYIRNMSSALALDMLSRAVQQKSPIGDYPSIKRVEQKVVDFIAL
ncbi:CinA family nicotinamide mononucleotide deamidase-related protein [Gammaproteobacteria bacterium AS21]